MELREQVCRQRVKHIISSYQLAGKDAKTFFVDLEELLNSYPWPLIELALAETLVDHWLKIPMPRGTQFLQAVQALLHSWKSCQIVSTITPEQFQHITGLDPRPIFGVPESPSSQQPTYSLGSGFS